MSASSKKFEPAPKDTGIPSFVPRRPDLFNTCEIGEPGDEARYSCIGCTIEVTYTHILPSIIIHVPPTTIYPSIV